MWPIGRLPAAGLQERWTRIGQMAVQANAAGGFGALGARAAACLAPAGLARTNGALRLSSP